MRRRAGRARPRTKPPETRREELMDAAEGLFLERGIAATTIEQITAVADVAKGTFYLHFPSKEAVRIALGERFGQRHLARIKAAIAPVPEHDWMAKLTAWAAIGVAAYLDAIRLHDLLFYGAPPTREGLVNNVVIDHLAGLLRAGAAAGAWQVDDPRAAAVFLFSGLHAVVDDAYLTEAQVGRRPLVRRVRRLCFRAVGLSAEPPGTSAAAGAYDPSWRGAPR